MVVGFAFASPTIREINISANSELDAMKVSVESLTAPKVVRFTISLIADFHPLDNGSTATLSVRKDGETISMVPLSALTNPDGEQFITFLIGTKFLRESNLTIFLNPGQQDIRAYYIDLDSFYNSIEHGG